MDVIRDLSLVLRMAWESTTTTAEGFWGLAGLGAFVLVLIFCTLRAWRGRPFALRPLPAVQRIRAAIGRAMETGEPLHVTLGSSGLGDLHTADTLAGLYVVSYLARRSAQAEFPARVRMAEPTALAGSWAALQQGAESIGYPEAYDPRQAEWVAPSPQAYHAGVASAVAQEPMALNALIGAFGPEVLLTGQAGLRRGVPQVGGTSAPTTLPLLVGTMDETLTGEEIYAVGAALDRPEHTGSLAAQDLFRAIIALGIVLATTLAVLERLR